MLAEEQQPIIQSTPNNRSMTKSDVIVAVIGVLILAIFIGVIVLIFTSDSSSLGFKILAGSIGFCFMCGICQRPLCMALASIR
jgi:uncharacterized membrane protein (DUF485 family)